jgi:glycosyltransferase involved in cell wall biosynthesis
MNHSKKVLEEAPRVSVIIPTHNRKNSLLRTLDSLARQTLQKDRFEIIVVDDGSTDDTQIITSLQSPLAIRYLYQKKQGATAARNYGARISLAEILVFIDDDVTISTHTLEALAKTCHQEIKALVTGMLIRRSGDNTSVYSRIVLDTSTYSTTEEDMVVLQFVDCNTELLACKRSDFFDLGMLQDPTEGKGWPNWDDVDFGYRAYLNGFQILRCNEAIGEHWDYSMTDRAMACQRWFRASKSAVWLFHRHRDLQKFIPMLLDKTPLVWGEDPPLLIARKLARAFASSKPVLGGIEKLVKALESYYPSPLALRRLYFWLHGAYMYHGYRQGLSEFKLAETQI